MIRIFGLVSLILSAFIIGIKAGWEAALYHGSPEQLAEAAALRCKYILGDKPELVFPD